MHLDIYEEFSQCFNSVNVFKCALQPSGSGATFLGHFYLTKTHSDYMSYEEI